jgi:integrase
MLHGSSLICSTRWMLRSAQDSKATCWSTCRANGMSDRRLPTLRAALAFLQLPPRAAGLTPLKYHATRHSFASWALRSQEPAHKVQLYLGHATIQQTLGTYYHATIGNQGELGGLERMMELGRRALPEKTSE